MDFKRIEWIFLIVFIGINIFLGIELWQTPTLLSAGSTPTQTDIKSETSADQITIPKVNDKQEDGYYLAAKTDNSALIIAIVYYTAAVIRIFPIPGIGP